MNLAALYEDEGRFADAEDLVQRAIVLDGKAWGLGWGFYKNYWVGQDLNELAGIYVRSGRYADAEPLYQRALTLTVKGTGQRSADTARAEWNLASSYVLDGKHARAEELLKHALHRDEQLKLLWHIAKTAKSLARTEMDEGKYADAEEHLKQSLRIEQVNLHRDSPELADTLTTMGIVMFARGQPDRGEVFFGQSFEILARRLEHYFTYMSEADRLKLLRSVRFQLSIYFSFAEHFQTNSSGLTGRMYDLLLWQKSMVVRSIEVLRRRVAARGDCEALGLLNELAAKRVRISTLMDDVSAGSDTWRQRMDALIEEADSLERKLVALSGTFALEHKEPNPSWQQVRDALRAKEADAAVEFVRFPVFDGNKWSNNSHYAALVLTPQSQLPIFVLLGDANNLEDPNSAVMKDYERFVKAHEAGYQGDLDSLPGQTCYDAFWKPVETVLAGANVVYVSPDGVLNLVSLNVLRAEDGESLLTKHRIHVVPSTQVLLNGREGSTSTTAVLVGNPNYAISDDEYQASLRKLLSSRRPRNPQCQEQDGPDAVRVANWRPRRAELANTESVESSHRALPPLPETATQIHTIQNLLETRKWRVTSYEGTDALVEAIRAVDSPRVLHLATHGVFEWNQTRQPWESLIDEHLGPEYSMLRSKLFFAGADRAVRKEPTNVEQGDGVLTAYEASSLHLEGTELVVLSACETGRGGIQDGEGVFGLLRAFEEAGADSVLVSMWKVPVDETQLLVTKFYENWLSGLSKHEALRMAQLTLRNNPFKRNLPYYWGAFVLVEFRPCNPGKCGVEALPE
jgi:CHAT domain-containing protein/tetratricopeptide (TPR) repeat protein